VKGAGQKTPRNLLTASRRPPIVIAVNPTFETKAGKKAKDAWGVWAVLSVRVGGA
jgi:hypothetical protein